MSRAPASKIVHRTFQDLSTDDIIDIERLSLLAKLGGTPSISWGELLKSQRVLIMSEAGAGKTFECQQQQRSLSAAGEPAFFIELAELAKNNLQALLAPTEESRFDQWRSSQSEIATFFLDSFDELKLTQGSFHTALTQLAKAVGGQLARTRIVITTRPIPIDRSLVEKILPIPEKTKINQIDKTFADIAMDKFEEDEDKEAAKPWRTVALMPLSDEQISEMALIQGVSDPKALLADIQRRNAHDFARRPQDLIELCSNWRENHRIGTHREQLANDIEVKLKPRIDRKERTGLSPEKAMQGASRLALAAILTRKLTFRHSAEADTAADPETALDPAAILFDWTADERATLLERALFGFANYGRVRFHHRSVVEFLTAEHLEKYLSLGMSIKTIKRLLFTETAQGDKVVRPTMRPIAAWLALYRDSIFSEVSDREPEVLLNHGDPESLTDSQKGRALCAYVERYGNGEWRGMHVPRIQVHRFAAPTLAPHIARLWPDVKNLETRELLLNVIAAGKLADCADIAFKVVKSSHESQHARLNALEALANMEDARLGGVLASMETDESLWPIEFTQSAVVRLFPTHLSVDHLLRITPRLTEQHRSEEYFDYHLPHLIANSDIDIKATDALRTGLTTLVGEDVTRLPNWPYYRSRRPYLVPALAAVSLRQLEMGNANSALIRSMVLALRMTDLSLDRDEHTNKLRMALERSKASIREAVFWADDAFLQAHSPPTNAFTNPFTRLSRVSGRGAVTLNSAQDSDWVRATLKKTSRPLAERSMMLEALLLHSWEIKGTYFDHVQELRLDVADSPELLAIIDTRLQPVQVDPEAEQLKAQWARNKAQEEQQEAEEHAKWLQFWSEITKSPDEMFGPEKAEGTLWNLWIVMKRSGRKSRALGWNRQFIETYFNKNIADHMQVAFRGIWRKYQPTLRSEREEGKKSTVLHRWEFGLAAISAEAEDPHWAIELTNDEARLACRYAPVALDGLPSWLDSLVREHPHVVDEVLGTELSHDLAEPANQRGNNWLLQNIGDAAPDLVTLFLPRLLAWLDEHGDSVSCNEDQIAVVERLNRVTTIVLKSGDKQALDHIRVIAIARLTDDLSEPFAKVWLPILMQLDPAAGTAELEKRLDALPPSPHSAALNWFSTLFGGIHQDSVIDLGQSIFTPHLLLRLVRAAYLHVRIEDDMQHEGAFTPIARDHAQYTRDRLIGALLQTKGADAWATKIALANDPLFVHIRDRVLMLSREQSAEEADLKAVSPMDIVRLERGSEIRPATRDDMFTLMLDRLDDIDDLLLQDVSPREQWAAITDERVMRRAISHQLKQSANGAYTLDQEAATADEKETDIRLRSVVSDQQATIELKIGEKRRSAKDLRNALEEQLVKKYMAAEACRSGCLLITVAKPRTWEHPDSGEELDINGLVRMLNEHARKLMNDLGGSLKVAAKVLNLIPRLQPEREIVASHKRKSSGQAK